MKIGLFTTQDDYSFLKRLREIIGAHSIALCQNPMEYFTSLKTRIVQNNLDAIIISCPVTMRTAIRALPEFKPTLLKTGKERTLSQDDYAGSCWDISAAQLGRDRDCTVLILNPLERLVYDPAGQFLARRYVSKITRPELWLPQPEFSWELASLASLPGIYEYFQTATLISIDTETNEGDPDRTISCVGYCGLFPDGTVHTVVIPIRSFEYVLWMRKFNVLAAPKILQNGGYDHAYFARYNSPVFNYLYDTLCLFHAWYAELPKRLDFVASFSVRKIRFWKNDGKTGDLMDHYEYNARDCYATLLGWLGLLDSCPDWAINNYLISFPKIFPCLHVGLDGLTVLHDVFDTKRAERERWAEESVAHLRRWFGGSQSRGDLPWDKWLKDGFNPRSPVQVKNMLQVLGIPNPESSDEPALNNAADIHPLNAIIIDEVLNARGYLKLLSAYFDDEAFWGERLYYQISPWATDSGRSNSSASSYWCGFNIQTMPERDADPGVKDYIAADEGWHLFEADNSQSEAYCTAYISGCESLRAVLEGPNDFHCWNASQFFAIPYEKLFDNVTRKQLDKPIRNLAKRTNHGASYNMGAAVMLQTMGPKAVAHAKTILRLPKHWSLTTVCAYLLDRYTETYPEVKKDYQAHVILTIDNTSRLVSALGWTRYFFQKPSKSKRALNLAVAHAPQNLSVNIIDKAFYNIWHSSLYGARRIKYDFRGRVRLKAQIHDSLLGCHKGNDTAEQVREVMQQRIPVTDIKGVTRTMEIPVEISYGKTTWKQLKDK